jgi:hypothetical protein
VNGEQARRLLAAVEQQGAHAFEKTRAIAEAHGLTGA